MLINTVSVIAQRNNTSATSKFHIAYKNMLSRFSGIATRNPLRASSLILKGLPNRNAKIVQLLSLTSVTRSTQSLPALRSSNQLLTIPPCQPRTLNKVLKRGFHTTSKKSIKFIFSKGDKDNHNKMKYYSIPTPVVILSTIGGFVLLFTILPFLFTFGFPFLIGMIVFFQFRRWKTHQLYKKMAEVLQDSQINMKNNQLMSLKYRLIEQGLPMLTNFSNKTTKQLSSRGETLINQLQQRIKESFANNDNNIANVFVPQGHKLSEYELLLSHHTFKSYTKKLPHDQDIGLLSLNLYMRRRQHRNIKVAMPIPVELNLGNKVANVYFVYKGDTARGLLNTQILLEAAKAGVDLQEIKSSTQFLISIVPLDSWLPTQYIIADAGSLGSFNEDPSSSSREFVINNKSK